MSGRIQLLPEKTANQIAAGEVVQRPASVVKELLENAIDAGATAIKLYIKNGGCTHIQVDDNGTGMNALDARMCWERHATSKITKADDLYNLHTLGFRGEALASIASVSDVEMKTKIASESVGTKIEIEAGKVLSEENVATTNGTSITVKNLFYNIPARKNFLKSITVETKHIFDEFQRIALSYPSVELSFYNQEKEVMHLDSGTLETRISQLLRVGSDQLIETSEQTDIVGITGFLGIPKLAKKTRGNQFLFANGRYIKDAYLNHAIVSAYEGLLEDKSYPFYVLFLDVLPGKIDVNIHPTKHEVKFEDGRHVYSLLKSVVKKSLGSHLVIPTMKQLEPSISQSGFQPSLKTTPPDRRFNPFGETKQRTSTEWEKLDELLNAPINTPKQADLYSPQESLKTAEIDAVFQLKNAYIVASIENNLWLIHQHRAHRQILFEQYEKQQMSSQQLLFPQKIELTSQQFSLYMSLQNELQKMGFDSSEFGKNNVIINGLPTEISKQSGGDVLAKVLDDFSIHFQQAHSDKITAIRLSGAKNSAIKAGRSLNEVEMRTMVNNLLQCKSFSSTEDGKTIVVQLDQTSLERFFH